MEDLIISGEVLEQAKINGNDLKIEIATYLYEKEKLSIGQAKRLAELDLISFQKELAKRDIYINYDVDDFKEDLKTISEIDKH